MNTKEAKEFFSAIDLIVKEKNMDKDEFLEKLKTAITLAVRKQYGSSDNVVIDMQPNEGKCKIYIEKQVVDKVENPALEISLDEALTHSKRAKIGSSVKIQINAKKIGRLAAIAAKQQIRGIVRDVEKEQLTMELRERIGETLIGKVVKIDPQTNNAIIKFSDGSSTILFKNKQLPNDNLKVGDVIRVYVSDLAISSQNSNLKVSRTHPKFVESLFKKEIPEISNNQIEIKAIARDPGFRTKIAVKSNDENIDPIGTCIGEKSIRLNAILDELKGEKIDLIPYDEDIKKFVSSSISPAKVVEVEIMKNPQTDIDTAYVSVPDTQLSLAIGNRGINAKLAAKLTGYEIDISPESGFYGEDKNSSLKEKLEFRFKQQNENNN